jgi:hypothetical protein
MKRLIAKLFGGLTLGALLWLGGISSSLAVPRIDAEASELVAQAGGMSLDQAIAMVQAKYGAKVMRANTVEEGGRVVHYIRLMSVSRSRVWTVRVDAATGEEF